MLGNHQKTFLKEATFAFQKVKTTADICAEHRRTCWVCRNKIARIFLRCHDWESIAFDHLVTKIDAAPYQIGLKSLQEEKKLTDAAPTTEWLEKLYELRDKRSE